MVDADFDAPMIGAGHRVGSPARERGPLVIVLAFAVAVAVGVLIGLATRPSAGSKVPAVTAQPSSGVTAAEAAPPLAQPAWESGRQAGAAQQAVVRAQDRIAFQSSYAAYMRQQSGALTPTTNDVSILSGKLFYGVIEGTSAAGDVYWAVGLVTTPSTVSPPENPIVWKRVGSAAWQVAQSGPGACSALPAPLTARSGPWQGTPGLCGGA